MSWVYALNDGEDKSRGCFHIPVDQAREFNRQGYGIFFPVNAFHTTQRRDDNLKEIRFWFIDMDEGSKETQFDKIVSFPLVPSMIVETKKGHHVYWKCKKEPTIKEYDFTIERLIGLFGSDKNAKGVARILRVPGFLHMKDPTKPYKIKKIFEEDCSYTTEEINKALPKCEIVVEKPKISFDMPKGNDDFWEKANSIDTLHAFDVLAGAPELRCEVVTTSPGASGKKHMLVNGKRISSCWVDSSGGIGSNDGGGPSITNWVWWYSKSWDETAKIFKKYFPELVDDFSCLDGFGGI